MITIMTSVNLKIIATSAYIDNDIKMFKLVKIDTNTGVSNDLCDHVFNDTVVKESDAEAMLAIWHALYDNDEEAMTFCKIKYGIIYE